MLIGIPILVGLLVALVEAQSLPDTTRWSVEVAAPVAEPPLPPLIAGKAVVLPLQGGAVAAHGLADGRELWRVQLNAQQELAADGHHVYVVSSGAVHAVRVDSGRPAWRADLGSPATAPPLAHAGWVVAAAAGELFALRAADGRLVWKAAVGAIEFRPAVDGDLLIVPVADGTVRALDIVTGQQLWAQQLGAPPLEPLAIADRVYVGTAGKVFFSLHSSSGRPDWSKPVGGILRGRAAVDDRHVYFAGMDNMLFALDRGTGAVRWRTGLTYRPAAGPVALGGLVVVPASHVRALPAFSPAAGTSVGNIPFNELLAVTPAFTSVDGRINAVAVVGSLTNRFRLVVLEPSLVPALPLEPLKAIPGDPVPLTVS